MPFLIVKNSFLHNPISYDSDCILIWYTSCTHYVLCKADLEFVKKVLLGEKEYTRKIQQQRLVN
jgi:hypothetical protein